MNEERYHIIDKYLAGELSGEELLRFEDELKNDASLAEDLSIFKMLNANMPSLLRRKEGADILKKTLQQQGKLNFNKKETKIISVIRNKKYWLAAAVSLAVITTAVLLQQQGNYDETKLYAEYAGNENISLVSRDTAAQEDLANATAYYNDGDYTAAVPFLEKALRADSSNIKYQIILSRCYIESANYAAAKAYLDKISSGESVYKYQATWLQALSSIKQKKKQECIAYLNTIPAQADEYAKAQELLRKLK